MLFGQCPNGGVNKLKGASLILLLSMLQVPPLPDSSAPWRASEDCLAGLVCSGLEKHNLSLFLLFPYWQTWALVNFWFSSFHARTHQLRSLIDTFHVQPSLSLSFEHGHESERILTLNLFCQLCQELFTLYIDLAQHTPTLSRCFHTALTYITRRSKSICLYSASQV